MSLLSEHLEKLMGIESTNGCTVEQWQTIHRECVNLITILCVSSSKEIEDFIKKIDLRTPEDCEKNMDIPPWIRLLAFRLLIAKNPGNKEYKEWAIASNNLFYEWFDMKNGVEWKNNFLE